MGNPATSEHTSEETTHTSVMSSLLPRGRAYLLPVPHFFNLCGSMPLIVNCPRGDAGTVDLRSREATASSSQLEVTPGSPLPALKFRRGAMPRISEDSSSAQQALRLTHPLTAAVGVRAPAAVLP